MDGFAPRYQSFAFTILTLLILIGAAVIVLPFFPAILWATVLSVLMYPFHRRLAAKWEASCLKKAEQARGKFAERFLNSESAVPIARNLSALVTTFATLFIIGIPLFAVGFALVFQVNSLTQDIEQNAPLGNRGLTIEAVLTNVDNVIKPIASSIGVNDFSVVKQYQENRQDIVRNITGPLVRAAGQAAFSILTLVIAFLTMFFMVRDAHRLREPALDLIPLPRDQSETILQKLQGTIYAVFYGVVAVAFLQGSLAGIMFVVADVPNALMWGVATIILCAIPLLGAPIVYIPMALMKFSQGEVGAAVGMLLFGFLVISQVDNLIRPIVIGARTSFHPMAVFFSLLGGVLVMGPVGIMAGPMLLAVLLVLIDVIRQRLRNVQAAA
jgi:predicted PurR-regulated permease PerM